MGSEFSDLARFCGECDYLSYTEKEQNVQKEISGRIPEHYCYRFEEKLYHEDMEKGVNYEPKIVKCEECRK